MRKTNEIKTKLEARKQAKLSPKLLAAETAAAVRTNKGGSGRERAREREREAESERGAERVSSSASKGKLHFIIIK